MRYTLQSTKGVKRRGDIPILEAELGRSIAVAADVRPSDFEQLVARVGEAAGVSSIIFGPEIGLGLGLSEAAEIVRGSGLIAVYDHQNAGTGNPKANDRLADAIDRAGIGAAILCPLAGPAAQQQMTAALRQEGIGVITRLTMPYADSLTGRRELTGGYIEPHTPQRILNSSIALGLGDFAVTGADMNLLSSYRKSLEAHPDVGSFALWISDIDANGGGLEAAALAAGPHSVAVIGPEICASDDPRAAAHSFGEIFLRVDETD